ncbi:hypothetical protein EZ449_09170 [Pedobacter frigidisoli]|uniref:Uncharacterized protein n=1 Tax=Pedobacter frigidisoli TaxID=2530455 RepID=A0A4R0P4C1_9SPHI|nr:hypothetical protein [Pedobacter frigidisoli]TCD10507.1 hypothetical protein EZ449_09170 [Pedobacter frigidisoli]
MKSYLTILITFIAYSYGFSQEKLLKDIDFDGVKDTVYFETKRAIIVCRLTSQKFKPIKSKPISIEYAAKYGIRNSENGFEFFIEYNRYGAVSQFRYEKESKKIRLIGMKHRESGVTEFDANGEASINLLNGNYIGNWAYNDVKNEKYLIPIPIIKQKMWFKPMYLNGFSQSSYDNFLSKSSALFVKSHELDIIKRNQTKH